MWSAVIILAALCLAVGWLMVKKDRLTKGLTEPTIRKVDFNNLSLLQRINILTNKTAELQKSDLSPCKDKLKLLMNRMKKFEVNCHSRPDLCMKDYRMQCMKTILWYDETDEYKKRCPLPEFKRALTTQIIKDLKETAVLHSKPIDLSKDVPNELLRKPAATGDDLPPFYPSVVWDAIWTLTSWLDDVCDLLAWTSAYIPSVNYDRLKSAFKFAWRVIVVTALIDFDTDTTTIIIDFMVPMYDAEGLPDAVATGHPRRLMFLCCTPVQYAKLANSHTNVLVRNNVP